MLPMVPASGLACFEGSFQDSCHTEFEPPEAAAMTIKYRRDGVSQFGRPLDRIALETPAANPDFDMACAMPNKLLQ